MENQITRSLTTKKVIEDFKAKKEIKLSEEDTEKYIDLIYFFSEQAFKGSSGKWARTKNRPVFNLCNDLKIS